jgi:hypothetical protein
MYIYVYICMYVCMHANNCTHACIYNWMNACLYVSMVGQVICKGITKLCAPVFEAVEAEQAEVLGLHDEL